MSGSAGFGKGEKGMNECLTAQEGLVFSSQEFIAFGENPTETPQEYKWQFHVQVVIKWKSQAKHMFLIFKQGTKGV